MKGRLQSAAGFTLIEMLVAMTIMLAVTGAVFTVLNPSSGMFQTQPEVSDLQQRLRIGTDTLTHDLLMAGAGAYSGSQSGSLVGFFAPVLPYRQGANAALDDGPGAYRTDAITLMYVPPTSSQTTVAAPGMPATSSMTFVNAEPGCPSNDPLCGFTVGKSVLIFDDTGAFDTFTVTQVTTNNGQGNLGLQHNQQGNLSTSYGPNAKIAELTSRVYYYDAATKQLKMYDGSAAGVGVPVVDNVVGLSFEYYGDPTPPLIRSWTGSTWTTTYGPSPKAVAQAPWAAGENCVFLNDGTPTPAPRLPTLGAPNGGLVQLTSAMLTDGPWCPNDTNSNRFDADLLRIRKIRVSLRVQTGVDSLRGALTTGPDALFTNAGTSTSSYRYVPDEMVQFDVTPRNLNLAR